MRARNFLQACFVCLLIASGSASQAQSCAVLRSQIFVYPSGSQPFEGTGTTAISSCEAASIPFRAGWLQGHPAQSLGPATYYLDQDSGGAARCNVSIPILANGVQFDTRVGAGRILDLVTGQYVLYGQEPACATITIEGPSITKALPAGPALPQIAKVTQNGAAVAGKSVTVQIGSGGGISGATNAAGEFHFIYMPPRVKALGDYLNATCTGCSNTATKQITVEACDICEAGNR